MSKVIDMRGQRFGMLQVLDYEPIIRDRAAMWRCRCDCGREILARGTSMRKGEKKSCGCQGRGLGKLDEGMYKWTKEPTGGLWNCRYQRFVHCEDRNCAKCGWNPDVAKARSEKILESLKGRPE